MSDGDAGRVRRPVSQVGSPRYGQPGGLAAGQLGSGCRLYIYIYMRGIYICMRMGGAGSRLAAGPSESRPPVGVVAGEE